MFENNDKHLQDNILNENKRNIPLVTVYHCMKNPFSCLLPSETNLM